MRRCVWAVGAVIAVVLIPASAAGADTTASTLALEGAGSVFMTPDVADLSVSVTRSGVSSRAALSAANRRTGAVVRAIRAVGVPASEIQTDNVSVSSRTVRVGSDRHRERRWTATESLAIHVTNIKIVGSVIDDATRAGSDTVDGPSFSFSDPSAGKLAATRKAIADARRRARRCHGSDGLSGNRGAIGAARSAESGGARCRQRTFRKRHAGHSYDRPSRD